MHFTHKANVVCVAGADQKAILWWSSTPHPQEYPPRQDHHPPGTFWPEALRSVCYFTILRSAGNNLLNRCIISQPSAQLHLSLPRCHASVAAHIFECLQRHSAAKSRHTYSMSGLQSDGLVHVAQDFRAQGRVPGSASPAPPSSPSAFPLSHTAVRSPLAMLTPASIPTSQVYIPTTLACCGQSWADYTGGEREVGWAGVWHFRGELPSYYSLSLPP